MGSKYKKILKTIQTQKSMLNLTNSKKSIIVLAILAIAIHRIGCNEGVESETDVRQGLFGDIVNSTSSGTETVESDLNANLRFLSGRMTREEREKRRAERQRQREEEKRRQREQKQREREEKKRLREIEQRRKRVTPKPEEPKKPEQPKKPEEPKKTEQT